MKMKLIRKHTRKADSPELEQKIIASDQIVKGAIVVLEKALTMYSEVEKSSRKENDLDLGQLALKKKSLSEDAIINLKNIIKAR